jgi:hypothetical protein
MNGRQDREPAIERMRNLVQDVAKEEDPDKIQVLFDEIRRLLNSQLAETRRKLRVVGSRWTA